MVKIGVLGGTFDPVHYGHLRSAEHVRVELKLAQVILVPAGQPYLKANRRITPARHRLAMLRLALPENRGLIVSAHDVTRSGPTYAVDTVRELLAGRESDAEVYFIMGWDSLEELPNWHRPERLVELCQLVAVPRPGSPRPEVKTLEKSVPGIGGRLHLLSGPEIDISASDIRLKVSRGEEIRGLVPDGVADYIEEQGLYRD